MMRRLIASLLIVSLVLLTPGGRFYEACAQTIAAPAARAGVSAVAGSIGAVPFNLSAPSLSAMLPQASLNATLSAPAAPAPLATPVTAASLNALTPAAVTAAAPAARPAALAPGGVSRVKRAPSFAFTPKTTGEDAAILFDQGALRPSALDEVLAPAASDSPSPPGDDLEKAKTPIASGAPAEPPSPAAKSKLPRSLWGLFWGHHITTVFGVNFHVLSLPFLVKDALGMGTAAMGVVRNIHMGSMAVVNLLPIGYLIDKTDYRVVFIATSLARAALMALIPILFMSGGLHFTVLAAIIAVNPIFQSAMIVADGAARKSFLGKDEKLNKDAAATLGKWDSVAGMLMPIIAGWAVGMMVTTFGLGGYAMAYGVYGALLLASIPFYWFMIRDARFPGNDKLGALGFAAQIATFMAALFASIVHPVTMILNWSFRSFFTHARPEFPASHGARALWAAREILVALAGAALLPLALVKGLWALPGAIKAARAGSGKKSLPDILERYKPMEGLAFILRNRTLRILTGVMALEVLLIDALPFVLIPSLITDALGAAPTTLAVPLMAVAVAAGAAALAAAARAVNRVKSWWPAGALGAVATAVAAVHFFPSLLLVQVATAGGVMGLLFSLEYVGRFIPSARLEGEKGDAIIEKIGHGRFYRRAAFASLLFWALLAPVFLTPGLFWVNLAIVSAVLFTVQYFHTPVGIVLEPVKRAEMDDDKLARIESAVFMVDVAFESIGALFLGLLLDYAGLVPALIATASFLTLAAILQYNVPRWIFPDGNRPAKKTPPPAAPLASAPAFTLVFA